MDPEAFRAESRDRWERSAAGWEATRERLQRDAAPVTEWLLDAAGLRAGDDRARGGGRGGGDRPAGRAPRRAGRPGDHHRRRRGDGRSHPAPGRRARARTTSRCARWRRSGSTCRRRRSTRCCAAGASCSWPTPRRRCASGAASCARAAASPSRSGRRPTRTRGSRRLHGLLVERGLAPAREPGEPGPFSLADPERLADLLWGAGLTGVRVEALDFVYRAASLDDWWEHAIATSSARGRRRRRAVARRALRVARRLRRAPTPSSPTRTARVAIPGRTLVADRRGVSATAAALGHRRARHRRRRRPGAAARGAAPAGRDGRGGLGRGGARGAPAVPSAPRVRRWAPAARARRRRGRGGRRVRRRRALDRRAGLVGRRAGSPRHALLASVERALDVRPRARRGRRPRPHAATGVLDGDGPFAAHGHVLVLRVHGIGGGPAAGPVVP